MKLSSSTSRCCTYATFLSLTLLLSPAYAQIRRAPDAPQPMSPHESAACVRLPAGFELELVAAEPVVEEPSCVAFDEWGRTFVCELHGYNVEGEIDVAELNKIGQLDKSVRRIRWELQGGPIAEQAAARQYGKLKLLVDENGDGVMDRAEVWADDLPPCYGIVPARGGIIVTCAPDIVFFADRDQDGKPDVRETLFTGFRTEVLERGVNNPRWGLDNWIYVGSGGSGGTITGPHLDQPMELGRSDFRIRPDGSAIEPVHGSVGTFGMTVNDFGDRFPASGGQPATYALPLPHRFLARNPHVPTPRSTHNAANYNRGNRISAPHPWRVQRRSDPAWIKFYGERETDSSYFSGGCSNEFYGDTLFPAEYQGCLFYCEPSLNIVHRCVLSRDGLRYQARRAPAEQDSEFLASTDAWFRPMNLRVGPHGELYIVDMYREIIEDYSAIPRFLQQQYGLDRGRQHGRLWRLTRTGAGSPAIPNLSHLSPRDLIAELNASAAWRRRTAQRLLVERGGADDVTALEFLLGQPNASAAIAALYTLQGLDLLKPDHLRRAIGHDDPRVGMHGIRLCHAWVDQDDHLLKQVVACTEDQSVVVRAEAVMALGATRAEIAQRALYNRLLIEGGDEWMAAAILTAATDHAPAMLRNLLQTTDPPALPAAFAALAATVASDADASALAELLVLLPSHAVSVQAAVVTGITDGLSSDAALQTSDWSSLGPLLDHDDSLVHHPARQLALKLQLRDTPMLREHFRQQASRALNPMLAIPRQCEAVRSLSGAPWEILAPVVTASLRTSQALDIQLAAIASLDASQDPRVPHVLLEGWNGYTPTVREAALTALFSRPERLKALWSLVQKDELKIAHLSAAQQEQLARHLEPEQATKMWRLLSADAAQAEQQLSRYQEALSNPRDLRHGRAIFEKTCSQCHRVGELGHVVGPDLGTITGKPDSAVLAEILAPSARIDPEYRTYTVLQKDGRSHRGILTSESATNLVLLQEMAKSTGILRRDIETIETSDVSLMPSNLHDTLTPQDVADLLGYLREAVRPAKALQR